MPDIDDFRITNKAQLTAALDVLSKTEGTLWKYRDGDCREFAHALLSLLPENTGRLLCGTKGSGYHYVVEAFGETWDVGGASAKLAYPQWYREQYPKDRSGSFRWKEEQPFKGRHQVDPFIADTARLQLIGAALTGADVGTDVIDQADYKGRRSAINRIWTAAFKQHLAKEPVTRPDETSLVKLMAGYPFLAHDTDNSFKWCGRPKAMKPIEPKSSAREHFSR